MSDSNIVPEPGKESEESLFDFSALTPEKTESILDFEAPDVKANKSKWWKRENKKTESEPKREKKVTPVPAMPRGGIAGPMAELYRKTGKFVKTFDYGCGSILIDAAEDCGRAWEELAKRNPTVRRWLLTLLSTSAVGDLIWAHAPIFMAVAIHHVPVVRNTMEKMAADAGEMFARMAAEMPQSDGEADAA